jgi:hypothetical protein
MPNWCENDLDITGPEEDVNAFFAHALGKDDDGEPLALDFNKIVPQPGTITRDLIQDPYLRSQAAERPDDELWYYWRLEHWGTKWQPDICQVEGEEDFSEAVSVGIRVYDGQANVMVTFNTANSPPRPVVLAMSRQFPALEFDLRFFEGGCGYNGLYVCKGGEVLADETGDYYGGRGG